MHRDVHKYPLVSLLIHFQGQPYSVEVAVSHFRDELLSFMKILIKLLNYDGGCVLLQSSEVWGVCHSGWGSGTSSMNIGSMPSGPFLNI